MVKTSVTTNHPDLKSCVLKPGDTRVATKMTMATATTTATTKVRKGTTTKTWQGCRISNAVGKAQRQLTATKTLLCQWHVADHLAQNMQSVPGSCRSLTVSTCCWFGQ